MRALRRLYYCGEWIESHALHVHMLAAPDYLGCANVVELAAKDRAAVERGLRLKKAGNAIVRLLGGRSVHPVGACIGGFTRAPRLAELRELRATLAPLRDDAAASVRWVAGFDLPQRRADIEFVALRHADEYPMNEGRLVVERRARRCAGGVRRATSTEHQVPHSTALHATLNGRGPYCVGPLARLNLNFDRLPAEVVAAVARRQRHHLAECQHLHRHRRPRHRDPLRRRRGAAHHRRLRAADAARRAGHAAAPGAAARSPRRRAAYSTTPIETDAAGCITAARIVPPTSQNQAQIEAELRARRPRVLGALRAPRRRGCAKPLVRSYDPCISCATHFLRLEIEER